jgi:DNA-binding transcriptional MocR family regulator
MQASALRCSERTQSHHESGLVGWALLRRFYNHRDGTCFPSYEAIADAAGCCRATVVAKLRILEQLGIVETIRRKVVASFTSRVHQVRFDVTVQTSNSYRFNLPIVDWPAHDDLALPLLQFKEQAGSKDQAETSQDSKTSLPADLAAALDGLRRCIESTAEAS